MRIYLPVIMLTFLLLSNNSCFSQKSARTFTNPILPQRFFWDGDGLPIFGVPVKTGLPIPIPSDRKMKTKCSKIMHNQYSGFISCLFL